MERTGARALYETLCARGVNHLFGIDSPEPLYAEIKRNAMKPITVRDERSGAIMADAFARVTGRAAVCTAIRGPGATNLITGVAEAWSSSVPMIALTSNVPTTTVGKHHIQDVDQEAMFGPVTKWTVRLDRPSRVSEFTERAFNIATTGRPGPVLVTCPDDVLIASGADAPTENSGPAAVPRHRLAPAPDAIEAAVRLLAEAKRPVILAGSGVLLSGAFEELREVAELLAAPVATTPTGKGAFDEEHSLSLGVASAYNNGRIGRGAIAQRIISEADVVLIVGSRADSVATSGWSVPSSCQPLVRIDINADMLTSNYSSALGILADARLGLAALATELGRQGPPRATTVVAAELERLKSEWMAGNREFRESSAKPIQPERVAYELVRALDADAIICTDASYSSIWAMEYLSISPAGRRFIAPRGFAGIGWGLPAAIGAKLAAPARQVVCLTGDGGFGYVFQELETAARYGIAITVVVLNNSVFGYQKHAEEASYGRSFETQLLDVDYGALARVLGCDGVRVEEPQDVAPAIRQALTSGRPTVIDAVVSADAFPPIGAFDGLKAASRAPVLAH